MLLETTHRHQKAGSYYVLVLLVCILYERGAARVYSEWVPVHSVHRSYTLDSTILAQDELGRLMPLLGLAEAARLGRKHTPNTHGPHLA